MGLPLAAVAVVAAGQAVSTDRPVVPSAGIATEAGPGALWVNPANMAYDPDPRYALLVSHDTSTAPTSIAGTGGVGALAVGVHHVMLPEGGDWSLDYATGIELPRRVALGVRLGWHLVDDGQNYMAYDLGASWRPLPWFGASAVAQNVGSASLRSPARSAAGFALRPLGRVATLGFDWTHQFSSVDDAGVTVLPEREALRLSGRIRPVEGLFLRSHIESVRDASAAAPQVAWGIGAELYVRGLGATVHGVSSPGAAPSLDDIGATAIIGTDEPDESAFRSRRRVPVLSLTSPPQYLPTGGFLEATPPSWLDTLELLRSMEADNATRVVVVRIGGADLPWALCEEVRHRIEALEQRGTRVVVYLHASATTRDYFVATAASTIVLHPSQPLALTGLSREVTHLRGLLDLVGVVPEAVARSEYKTAPDQLGAHEPSAASLEQEGALLDDQWAALVGAIASGRDVDDATAAGWVDAGPWLPRDARAAGLVDALAWPDQMDELVDRVALADVHPYDIQKRATLGVSPWESPTQIGVVYIEGPIVSGPSSPGGLLSGPVTGSSTVVEHLLDASEDPQIRAVVLRVDSPGGSVFASEEIHRAVALLREQKPVVVSMGGVAASGGYYVAAGADAIWAEPTTITGSIGVYGTHLTFDPLLDRLGVTSTTLTRGRAAGIDGLHPWDAVERERMDRQIAAFYLQFKERVAEGRAMDPVAVEAVARGRVWSGARAKEIGLIDALGGLQDAVQDARERAGVPATREITLVSYSSRGRVIDRLTAGEARATLGAALSPPNPAPPPLTVPDALRAVSVWSRLADEGALYLAPELVDLGVAP